MYKPTRLIVKQPCITVTGTIVDATKEQAHHEPDGVRHEADADTHGWLKLDPQFEDLLNPGNISNEGGNLVFEIVCKFVPPSQEDAKPACAGYTSPVSIPPVGSHVQIVGTYVRDTNHAQWMEIHPVTRCWAVLLRSAWQKRYAGITARFRVTATRPDALRQQLSGISAA